MIKISLLGTFEVVYNGKPVAENDWHTRQARQLLKILITARPQPVASDRLTEILWPDSTPKAAATTLRSAINALRNVLEPDRASRARSKYIHTQTPGYAFREHPDIWLDVTQFEQNLRDATRESTGLQVDGPQSPSAQTQKELLTTAIDLYRDDYLTTDPYADWAHDERERLRESYFGASLQLASIEAGAGEFAAAIARCRQILARDNIREKAYQSLMRYQAESGDSAAALLTYDRCRTVLLEELGADPSPVTQALHQQILTGEIDPQIQPKAQPTSVNQAAAAPSAEPATRQADLPPRIQMPVLDEERLDIFVGRADETAQFTAKLEQALAGQGRLLAIIGEAGIGKTRFAYNLLQVTAQESSEKQATILSTACHALEQPLPFAPLIDVVNRYLQSLPAETLAQLSPTNLTQLARILPSLRDRLPTLPAPPTADALDRDENRRLLIDGIVSFFTDLARVRPLLIFVDDLHWADTETIFVLSRLSHQIADLPLCLLVAYREGDATSNSPLLKLQHAEHRLHPTNFLTLERLRLEHIQSFVQQYFRQKFQGEKSSEKGGNKKQKNEPSPSRIQQAIALAKLLYNTTRGNALFVTESIKALDEFNADEPTIESGEPLSASENSEEPSEAKFGHLLSLRRNQRVQELIIERIERLPEEAIDVLQIAAAIGRDFHTDLLEAVADDDPINGLERLLERQFLLERPDERIDFNHGVVRQVAYDSMSTLHRRRLHQRVGDAMVHLQLAENAPSQVAFQYGNAGRNARIPYARYSVLAGRKLLATYGYHQAIDYFDDALFVLEAIPETDSNYEPKLIQQALIGRGLAAESLLEPELMIDTYRRQQRWAHKQNNRTFLLTAQGRLLLMLALTGQQRQSNELLQELIQFIVNDQDVDEPDTQSRQQNQNQIGEKASSPPALEESPVLVDLITRRQLIYRPSPLAESTTVGFDAEAAPDEGNIEPRTEVGVWSSFTLPQPAVEGAREHFLQVLPPLQAVLPLFDYGWVLRIQGQLDESETCLKAVIELATETSQNFIASAAYHQLAVAVQMRGDLKRSHELNEKSIALNSQLQGAATELASLWPRIGSAFFDLRNGQVDRAERRLNRVMNFLQNRHSFRSHFNSAKIGLGEVALNRDDSETARKLFNEALADSSNLYPYTYVRALLGQARLAHQDNDSHTMTTQLQSALHFAGTRSLIEEYAETVIEITRLQPADTPIQKLVDETKTHLKSMGLNEVYNLLTNLKIEPNCL